MRYKAPIAAALVLVLIALGGAIVLAAWPLIERPEGGFWRWRALEVDQVMAEETQEQRLGVDGPATLIVDNQRGGITVVGGSTNEVVITARKRVWAATEALAQSELASLAIVATQEGNTVRVWVEQIGRTVDYSRRGGDVVDFTIAVPAQISVTAGTRRGDVVVSGTKGAAVLQTQFGAIEARDVEGGLKASSGSGSIAARRVYAGEGDVRLTSRFGKIEYESGSASSVTVDGGSGGVMLTALTVGGDVVVETRFGSVGLKDVAAQSYDLDSRSGQVSVERASGRLKARSGFGRLSVTGAENVDLDLETSNGAIDFAGSPGSGPHFLKTSFGSIRLSIPREAVVTVDLSTNFGKVKAELPITVTGVLEKSRWIGSINGGGASLVASTRNGDITIEALAR